MGFMDDIRTQIKAMVDQEFSKDQPDAASLVETLFSAFKDIYVENYYHALNQGVAQGIRMVREGQGRTGNPTSTEDGEPQPLPGQRPRSNARNKAR